MTTTMENKVNTSVAALKVLMQDEAVKSAATLDEAYETLTKYGELAKEDFVNLVEKFNPVVEAYEAGEPYELSEEDLEGVAGGSVGDSIGSFFKSVGETAGNIWGATPVWLKAVLIGAAFGCACGVAASLFLTGLVGIIAGGSAALTAATGAGVITGVFTAAGAIGGLAVGVYESVKDL